MSVHSHRDLNVWQKAIDFVSDCYKVTQEFPRHEIYGLTSQLRRAAVSVPANIAEGKGRTATKAYLNHLDIAHGSLAEVDTHLTIALKLKYLSVEDHVRLMASVEEVGRMLNGLRRSLEASLPSS